MSNAPATAMKRAFPVGRRLRAWAALATLAAVASAGCGKPPPPRSSAPAEPAKGPAPAGPTAVVGPALAARVPPRPVEGQTVTYGTLNGKSLKGYFVKPRGSGGGLPGVIVFHEMWGLNDTVRGMADQLASRGYSVLAADLYGGRTATTRNGAKSLMKAALARSTWLDKNIAAAFAYLKDCSGAPKIATLGWSLGGEVSFEAAQVLGGQLAATVIYYGAVSDNPVELAKLKAPVLGLFGGRDRGIPVARVENFEKGLEADGDLPIVKIYPDAGAAFANPFASNYRKDDADDAWKRTLDFLGENLKT